MKKKTKIISSVLGVTALGGGVAVAAVAQACATTPAPAESPSREELAVTTTFQGLSTYDSNERSGLSLNALTIVSAFEAVANEGEIQAMNFSSSIPVVATTNADGTINLLVGTADAQNEDNNFQVIFPNTGNGATNGIPHVWYNDGQNALGINNIQVDTTTLNLTIDNPLQNITQFDADAGATASLDGLYGLRDASSRPAEGASRIFWDATLGSIRTGTLIPGILIGSIRIANNTIDNGLIGNIFNVGRGGTVISINRANISLSATIAGQDTQPVGALNDYVYSVVITNNTVISNGTFLQPNTFQAVANSDLIFEAISQLQGVLVRPNLRGTNPEFLFDELFNQINTRNSNTNVSYVSPGLTFTNLQSYTFSDNTDGTVTTLTIPIDGFSIAIDPSVGPTTNNLFSNNALALEIVFTFLPSRAFTSVAITNPVALVGSVTS